MREMRDYQEIEKEILKDHSKIVIGNYSRCDGQTFLLVN